MPRTFELFNPILKSDSISNQFQGKTSLDAAKSAYKTISKFILNKNDTKFLFSLKDGNKVYHFKGEKMIRKSGSNKKIKLKITRHTISSKAKNQMKLKLNKNSSVMQGGKKHRKNRHDDDSSSSSTEDFTSYLRKKYLFPPSTYWYYDPLYYSDPYYGSYILDRNLFYPGLYYPSYPYYSDIIVDWGI